MSRVIFSPGVSKTFYLGLEHLLHQQALLRGLEQIPPVLQGVPPQLCVYPITAHICSCLPACPHVNPSDQALGSPFWGMDCKSASSPLPGLLKKSVNANESSRRLLPPRLGWWFWGLSVYWALKQHRPRSAQTHYIHPLSPQDLFFQIPTLSPTSVLCGVLTWRQSPSFSQWLREAAGPRTPWFFTTQVLVTAGWHQHPVPRNPGTHKLNLIVCFRL